MGARQEDRRRRPRWAGAFGSRDKPWCRGPRQPPLRPARSPAAPLQAQERPPGRQLDRDSFGPCWSARR